MKKLAFLTLLAIAALISSCGSNTIAPTPTSTANGNWEAVLTGGAGPAASLNFMINFNVSTTNGNGTQTLNVPYFSFINASPCFPNGAANVHGTAQLTNNTNTGQITGSILLTISSGSTTASSSAPASTTLTLSADPFVTPATGEIIGTANSGVMTNGAVNGQWTLTSNVSGCTAGGSSAVVQPGFTMCQNASTCTTAVGAATSTPVLN